MAVTTGLTMTDAAAAKLREILKAREKDPAEYGLRVAVKGGGCSGFMYVLDLDRKKQDDHVFEDRGTMILVDPKSILFLRGAEIDYQESLMGAGFKVRNPNEKSRCGCGESFQM